MFTLDQEAAKSVGQSNRINESGIYAGVITRFEYSESQSSQAKFVNIDFKTNDGREANYMSLCYQKGDGGRAFGYNTIMAIMACTGVNQTSMVNHNGKNICPELTNKPIAFALQAEGDWFQDKETGDWKPTTNMHIAMPFDVQTRKTAKETLENSEAKTVNVFKPTDKPGKPKPMPTQAQQGGYNDSMPSYDIPPANFDDEDFPF